MDLSVFFSPVDIPVLEKDASGRLNRSVVIHSHDNFPSLEGKKLALLGVKEDRRSNGNEGCANGPDVIRKYFYQLHACEALPPTVDLGNIEAGAEFADTQFAVQQVCGHLIKNGIIPIILGGSQDITFLAYRAYEELEQTINLVTVDPKLDFGSKEDEAHAGNYLNEIVLYQPNYLFNYSNVGHQHYLVEKDLLELMKKMFFDTERLGRLFEDVSRAEPIIRNADIVSMDISAVRHSDAPGTVFSGPNGLYGEQFCQIARYAGMSDKLTSMGFYNYNPEFDRREITAHLIAQALWCFIEGVSQRKGDYPIGSSEDYYKYIVDLPSGDHQMVFYKSNRTDRWWLDVPYPAGMKNKYHRHHLVPCTYEDYQKATNEELPDLWWRTYQKLT
jgi:formiminoglutamase